MQCTINTGIGGEKCLFSLDRAAQGLEFRFGMVFGVDLALQDVGDLLLGRVGVAVAQRAAARGLVEHDAAHQVVALDVAFERRDALGAVFRSFGMDPFAR